MKRADQSTLEWLRKLDYRIVILLGILLYYAVYWGSFKNFTASIDHNNSTFPDFATFYYPAGEAILQNETLPDSFYYSVFAAILFLPFAFFPPAIALILWGIVQFSFIFILFLTYAQKLPKKPDIGYVLTFIFFTNAALLNNLKWGQVSTLIFWGTFTAFLFYEQNKQTLSAIVLGIVIAVKFFPAIFLLYFFFRRDWKYLFVCLFVVLLCVLVIPAMVIGPSETIQSQLMISEHATAMMRALAMDNIDSQYFASVITRIMYMPITSQFTKILIIAGYLIAASAVYLVYRISEAQIEYSAFWAWGILSATIPFWIPSAWPHYFVYLPFLQVLAYCHISNINLRWRKPAIVLWIFSLTFSSIFITHIVQNWFRYVGFGSLFWSSIFILTVILIILLPNLAKRNTQSCSENFSPSP